MSEPRDIRARPLWLIAPSIVVALAMLVAGNAWIAMLGFHLTLIVAMIVHRRQLDWRQVLARPRSGILAAHLFGAMAMMTVFSLALFAYANHSSSSTYGGYLDEQLTAFGVAESSRIWFAVQLCLLNPLLEELFWRGLFFSRRKGLAATDACYAAFHFFALAAFMPVLQASVGTLALIGVGYALRQLAARFRGSIVVPVVWHALGDLAVVVAIARLTA